MLAGDRGCLQAGTLRIGWDRKWPACMHLLLF